MVIQRHAIKPEYLFSFIAAMVLLFNPVKKLSSAYNTLQRSLGAAERVFEAMDEKPEIVDPAQPRSLAAPPEMSAFRDVWFGTTKRTTGFSGTSTLRLIAEKSLPWWGSRVVVKPPWCRSSPVFTMSSAASVCIDGIDIRSLRLQDLLNQIALVDQETILFNDSISNNIRYGKPDATDTEVEAAARAAFAHDFIMEMPDGYATNIGDRGVRLSGGQRQRICIARAILKNAPILILDEATSALDTESEQMVQNALNNLMANRTTFVIAHRLSTIHHADKIVVLDNGEIVETGRHAELLARGGVYKKLYEMQFQN